MEAISPYEVRCARCDVTFPPEAKRCMHCGAPTQPSIVTVPDAQPELRTSVSVHDASPASGDVGTHVIEPFDAQVDLDDEEAMGRRPSVLRSLSTVIWVALAVIFSVMRVCSEG